MLTPAESATLDIEGNVVASAVHSSSRYYLAMSNNNLKVNRDSLMQCITKYLISKAHWPMTYAMLEGASKVCTLPNCLSMQRCGY
jgi:hypothetical protein